jgi:hypothetical protein
MWVTRRRLLRPATRLGQRRTSREALGRLVPHQWRRQTTLRWRHRETIHRRILLIRDDHTPKRCPRAVGRQPPIRNGTWWHCALSLHGNSTGPPIVADDLSTDSSTGSHMLRFVAVNTPPGTMIVLALAALAFAVGCGGHPPLNVGDGGEAGEGAAGRGASGGVGGAGDTPTCAGLDAKTCDATPGCSRLDCATCDGASSFSKCYRRGGGTVFACPFLQCPVACGKLDEVSCKTGGCQPLYCADCKGGQTFATCGEPGAQINCGPCPPPPACDTLNEISCRGRTDCRPSYCSTCDGGNRFALCAGPNEAAACPGLLCPPSPCTSLPDAATCRARGDCHTLSCPDCRGGQTYLGCGGSDAVVVCGDCPPVGGPCALATSLLACDGRIDCHPVFGDVGGCNCGDAGAGCCIGFERCAEGSTAACTGTPACKVAAPNCGVLYVASHTAMCYDGCVLPSECAP